jgi:hypothetical protein
MAELSTLERFAALRGRAHELHLLTGTMVDAPNVETYDRAYDQLCKLLEPIGERLEMFSMDERGYDEVGPDTWRRRKA